MEGTCFLGVADQVHMKDRFLSLCDKQLLRKRALVETVNDQLKNISQVEHTRHRLPLELPGQRGGRVDRLHLAGEEAAAEHSGHRAVPYLELTLCRLRPPCHRSAHRHSRALWPLNPPTGAVEDRPLRDV